MRILARSPRALYMCATLLQAASASVRSCTVSPPAWTANVCSFAFSSLPPFSPALLSAICATAARDYLYVFCLLIKLIVENSVSYKDQPVGAGVGVILAPAPPYRRLLCTQGHLLGWRASHADKDE
jgi:hypothetical protein